MLIKTGCVVYNPKGRSWCVLVETVMKDGSVRRFMSFHETRETAQMIKNAHENVNKDNPEVKISMFEYDYISGDLEVITRLIVDGIKSLKGVSNNEQE